MKSSLQMDFFGMEQSRELAARHYVFPTAFFWLLLIHKNLNKDILKNAIFENVHRNMLKHQNCTL